MSTVECPECGKVLKTANPIAPGKKVRCPGCKGIFMMPAPKAATSTAVRTKSTAVPKRPPIDDDDDLPTPKRKRMHEDDEDIDDREDEDEEDRPRKKKKRKKQAGPNWALIGGGAGAALVILILVAGFVYPGFFKGGGGPSGPALAAGTGQENLLAYLPRNSQIFVGLDATKNADVAKLLQEGLLQKMEGQMQQIPGAVGGMPASLQRGADESLRDAQRMIAGISAGPQPAMAIAVSTAKPVDVKKLAQAFGVDKTPAKTHEGKPYYMLPDGPPGGPPLFFGIPNNRIVLVAGVPEEEFKSLLASSGQQVQLSGDAQSLIGEVKTSYFWAVAVISGELRNGLQMINAKDVAKMAPELVPAVGALKQLKGASFWADETPSKDQKITIGLACANNSDATAIAGALNTLWLKKGRPGLAMVGMMAMQPGMEGLGDLVNDVSKSLKIESKGAVALASLSITEKTMKKMEQMQGQMLQGFGGLNPAGGQPPGGFDLPPGVPPNPGQRPKGPKQK